MLGAGTYTTLTGKSTLPATQIVAYLVKQNLQNINAILPKHKYPFPKQTVKWNQNLHLKNCKVTFSHLPLTHTPFPGAAPSSLKYPRAFFKQKLLDQKTEPWIPGQIFILSIWSCGLYMRQERNGRENQNTLKSRQWSLSHLHLSPKLFNDFNMRHIVSLSKKYLPNLKTVLLILPSSHFQSIRLTWHSKNTLDWNSEVTVNLDSWVTTILPKTSPLACLWPNKTTQSLRLKGQRQDHTTNPEEQVSPNAPQVLYSLLWS